MNLELSAEERDELVRIVENYLSDTRVEVRRTRTAEYRDQLHEEQDLLTGLLEKLKGLSA